jgi:hypothetical protein
MKAESVTTVPERMESVKVDAAPGPVDRLVVLWIGEAISQVRVLAWLLIKGMATAAILAGPGTAISRGCGEPAIEATVLGVNLELNLVFMIALVLHGGLRSLLGGAW